MKEKLTKILAVSMTAAMVVSVVGCGSGSTATTAASEAASGGDSAAAAGTEAAAAATEADAEATTTNRVYETETGKTYDSAEVDTVTFAIGTVSSLSPFGTSLSLAALYEVYEMLWEYDQNQEPYPVLADASRGEYQGYDHEAGTGVYDVYIYDNIYDHNGNHVTASDVAFSFTYQYENAVTSNWDDFVSAEAIDDTTCRFTFSEEQTALGWFVNFFCRQFIIDEDSFNASSTALAADMCGTGPYKFVEYVSGSTITLEKNEDYWQTDASLLTSQKQANADQVVYSFVDEETQKVIGLQTGTVDVAQLQSAENRTSFIEGGEYFDQFNIYTGASNMCAYLLPNVSEESIMNDINLRNALFYSVDHEGLLTALGKDYTFSYILGSPNQPDYDTRFEELENYNTAPNADLTKVSELLSEAGYQGEAIKVYCMQTCSVCSEVIVNMWTAAGLNIELNVVDYTTLMGVIGDDTLWDVIITNMAGDYLPSTWQHAVDESTTSTGMAPNFADDPEWQELLDQVSSSEENDTYENQLAWWQHTVDNAYLMALYNGTVTYIVPKNVTYTVVGTKNTILPGAFVFSEE